MIRKNIKHLLEITLFIEMTLKKKAVQVKTNNLITKACLVLQLWGCCMLYFTFNMAQGQV